MPVGPVLRIASQVVSALGAAAFHRIAHRALNPSNLVLVPGQTAEGEWPLVKVLHFVGGALRFPANGAAGAAPDNSSAYASPEQLRNGTVDFRSEIYSLGATMWFLLTGAPPLLTPKGPTAVQPTRTGLAVDRMTAVPKNVRRLLAQMLSANPDARPRDPLAFYRQLQDCLNEVEQRETITHRVGVPVSRTDVIRIPKRRRNPLGLLARAALFLGLAAGTAWLLRGYVEHRRVVHAEEPIGVPIGVSDASASATPVNPKAPDAIASVVTSSTPLLPTRPAQGRCPKRAQSRTAPTRYRLRPIRWRTLPQPRRPRLLWSRQHRTRRPIWRFRNRRPSPRTTLLPRRPGPLRPKPLPWFRWRPRRLDHPSLKPARHLRKKPSRQRKLSCTRCAEPSRLNPRYGAQSRLRPKKARRMAHPARPRLPVRRFQQSPTQKKLSRQ